MSMLNTLLGQGGPIMYPLAGCSIFAVAVILERTWFWCKEKRQVSRAELKQFIEQLSKSSPTPHAVFEATEGSSPFLGRVRMLIANGNVEVVADAIALEINDAEERAFRNLSALSMIIAIAPLLGILGTVLGIIDSFSVLQDAMLNDPALVGAGLAAALLTTAVGLVITVPCVIALTLFRSLSARHVQALERFANELDLYLEVSQADQTRQATESASQQDKPSGPLRKVV